MKTKLRKKPTHPRPQGKTWKTAKLYRVYLGLGFPVCGFRFIWAVVGRKHVRLCTPITLIKFRTTLVKWQAIDPKDRELIR